MIRVGQVYKYYGLFPQTYKVLSLNDLQVMLESDNNHMVLSLEDFENEIKKGNLKLCIS